MSSYEDRWQHDQDFRNTHQTPNEHAEACKTLQGDNEPEYSSGDDEPESSGESKSPYACCGVVLAAFLFFGCCGIAGYVNDFFQHFIGPPLTKQNVPEALRVWTSAVGDYSITARFAGMKAGVVKLVKADGEEVQVRFESLSAGDKEWIQDRAGGAP